MIYTVVLRSAVNVRGENVPIPSLIKDVKLKITDKDYETAEEKLSQAILEFFGVDNKKKETSLYFKFRVLEIEI